jgi:hypothetical protein
MVLHSSGGAQMTSATFSPQLNDWSTALWIGAHYGFILLLAYYHWFNDFCLGDTLKSVHFGML